jgi:hypothetical protein
MCIFCCKDAIAGIALSSISKRKLGSLTRKQKRLYERINWLKVLSTPEEPADLEAFINSLDIHQLKKWHSVMDECFVSTHFTPGSA